MTGKLQFGESSFNDLFYKYKSSAKKRNYEFRLTKEDFYKLTQSDCIYCGEPPNRIYTRKQYTGFYNYNGIDRVENDIGYVIENVVPCCKTCNIAKHTMSLKQFYKWIEKVHTKRKEQKQMTNEIDNLFQFQIDESLLPDKIVSDTEHELEIKVENGFVNYRQKDGRILGRPTSTPDTLNHADMTELINLIHREIQDTRSKGAAEYANSDVNCFGNFDRLSATLGISPEQVLLVYLTKHMDGINSYVKGHKSQRESVKGRIVDAIVYLNLLYGMVLRSEKWVIDEPITYNWKIDKDESIN